MARELAGASIDEGQPGPDPIALRVIAVMMAVINVYELPACSPAPKPLLYLDGS